MAYKVKKMKFSSGNAIEVMEYHTAKYGAPGQGRVKKKKATPEQMEYINQYNKERICRWKIREHFDVNDYFSVLTYRRDERPEDMDKAKEHFKKFIRKVKAAYKKAGHELKWIRNIEVGTKNGWHIHIIINRIPNTDVIIKNAWPFGKVVSELLYQKGEFAALAAYITKTPYTDKRLKESSYSTSRNLPLPEPEEKIYLHYRTWKKIRIPDGFYVDTDSLREGTNPVTGYPYRSYTLLRYRRN